MSKVKQMSKTHQISKACGKPVGKEKARMILKKKKADQNLRTFIWRVKYSDPVLFSYFSDLYYNPIFSCKYFYLSLTCFSHPPKISWRTLSMAEICRLPVSDMSYNVTLMRRRLFVKLWMLNRNAAVKPQDRKNRDWDKT